MPTTAILALVGPRGYYFAIAFVLHRVHANYGFRLTSKPGLASPATISALAPNAPQPIEFGHRGSLKLR
jgi:lipopolysaccharide/colanic/teichoic acid biosynthesis glycosyltransferase